MKHLWSIAVYHSLLFHLISFGFNDTFKRLYFKLAASDRIHVFSQPARDEKKLIVFVLLPPFRTAALLGARFRSNDTSLNVDDGLEGNGPLDIPAGCNMGRRRSRAVLYQLSGHYVSSTIQ